MGCCRSSIINYPKNFLLDHDRFSSDFTNDEARFSDSRKKRVKINLRESLNFTKGHLYQYYDIGDVLGEGAFGCVRKGVQLSTGYEVAIKTIPKSFALRTDDSHAIVEVEVLRKLDHPNILRIVDVVEDTRNYHIVTELCTGGEFFAKIISMKTFSESVAAGYLFQVLNGLAFCHSHGVLHRDIKPENLLLQNEAEDSPIKIIDFGVSNLNYDHAMLNVKQFTSVYYRAPEQFNGMCNDKSDLWSVGVIMYLMLSGYLPFTGKNEKQMALRLATQELSFPEPEWGRVTEEAKDLLRHMLEKNSELRWSAKDAFKHPWIQNAHSQYLLTRSISISGFQNLSRFRCKVKLRHAVLGFIISHVTNNREVYNLQQAFIAMDFNGDGKLNKEEITVACMLLDFPKDDVLRIMSEADANINGVLDYTEFLTAASNWKNMMNKNKLKLAFEAFDINKDGFITISELKELLGNEMGMEEEVWQHIFNEVDINNDGKIDLQEFEDAVLITS
jgi:calcium-dependent protein kinase